MSEAYTFPQLRELVVPVAKQFGVKRIYAFGSYGRRQATPQSDLDIRIAKGAIRSLFELADFRLTLEEALAILVDVVTADISDKRFLESIASDEVLLFDETQDSITSYSGKNYTEQQVMQELGITEEDLAALSEVEFE